VFLHNAAMYTGPGEYKIGTSTRLTGHSLLAASNSIAIDSILDLCIAIFCNAIMLYLARYERLNPNAIAPNPMLKTKGNDITPNRFPPCT
jgi:hypothetical protein